MEGVNSIIQIKIFEFTAPLSSFNDQVGTVELQPLVGVQDIDYSRDQVSGGPHHHITFPKAKPRRIYWEAATLPSGPSAVSIQPGLHDTNIAVPSPKRKKLSMREINKARSQCIFKIRYLIYFLYFVNAFCFRLCFTNKTVLFNICFNHTLFENI